MNKFKAFATHLGLSMLVVGAVLSIIVFVWYPSPLFFAMSGWAVVKILIAVDLILGPLLTFVVYKPNKPSLKFDLTVIALIQISALVYGTFVFFKERPFYLVHAVDVFHIVSASEIDVTKMNYEELKQIPLVGPRMAIALLPDSEEARNKLTQEVMMDGMADIERREEFYHPYEDYLDKVIERSLDINDYMNRDPHTKKKLEKFKQKHPDLLQHLVYVPLKSKHGFMTLAIDRRDGLPVDGIDIEL